MSLENIEKSPLWAIFLVYVSLYVVPSSAPTSKVRSYRAFARFLREMQPMCLKNSFERKLSAIFLAYVHFLLYLCTFLAYVRSRVCAEQRIATKTISDFKVDYD